MFNDAKILENRREQVHNDVAFILNGDQIAACTMIGALGKDAQRDQENAEFETYPEIMLRIVSTLIQLQSMEDDITTRYELNKASGVRKARIIIGVQAFTYFNFVLGTSYNDIFPPVISVDEDIPMATQTYAIKRAYAQTRDMKYLNDNLKKGHFETILGLLQPTHEFGKLFYKAINDLESDQELKKVFPYLQPALYELVDTWRLLATESTVTLKQNLKYKNKYTKLENLSDYEEHIRRLVGFISLLDNYPKIDITTATELRRIDLEQRRNALGERSTISDDDLNMVFESWEDFVRVYKEQFLLQSLENYTLEAILESLSGINGDYSYEIARSYISAIYNTFGSDEKRINILWEDILEGLHRYGRNSNETEAIISGLRLNVPQNERVIMLSKLKEKIPALLAHGLIDPTTLPFELRQDKDILITLFRYFPFVVKDSYLAYISYIQEFPLNYQISSLAEIVNNNEESKTSIGFHDLLWLIIGIGNEEALKKYIKDSTSSVEKSLILQITKILKNQRVYPAKRVQFNYKHEDRYIRETNTTYDYICALIVGSIQMESYARKELRKLYSSIKKLNPEFAQRLSEYSDEVGITIRS